MRKGFTLLELLIVLGIIALLTAIVSRVSFDALLHARALQVSVNLTEIMKAAQGRLLTLQSTTNNLDDLALVFKNQENYAIDMAYISSESVVVATVSYAGNIDKERIKSILSPDSSADDSKAYYFKSFEVYW